MTFGSQLNTNLHREWKFQYVDYDELKRLLKSAEEGTGFGDKNEALFVGRIESELDKVNAYVGIYPGMGIYGKRSALDGLPIPLAFMPNSVGLNTT